MKLIAYIISLIFHGSILMLLLVDFDLFKLEKRPEPEVITLEIIDIAEFTNLPTAKKLNPNNKPDTAPKEERPKPPPKVDSAPPPAQKPKINPTPKAEPAPVAKKQPKLEQPKEENKSASSKAKQIDETAPPKEKAPESKPDDNDKVAEEKPAAPKAKPQSKPKAPSRPEPEKATPKNKDQAKDQKKDKQEQPDDFMAVLKNLDQLSSSTEGKKQQGGAMAVGEAQFDENQALSISQIDAIRQQIQRNWNPPVGAREASNLVVTLRISLLANGGVKSVRVINSMGHPFFQAAAESAVRAVWLANPLQNLPANKYDLWKEIELNFNPRDAL
jgi:TolA protein